MNLSLLGSLACALVWVLLVFVAHNGSAPVHVLWAAAVLLAARRVLAGAPRFLS
ncbi:MAG TPA: hypothetical protein VLV16_12190 [Gemmatimonadales bacterium]|nr:hypothetical protein [Gemmatimonadales bacterium]